MKPSRLIIAICLLFASSAHAVFTLAPNGDFENGGADWGEAPGGTSFFSFPATGGNTGGHARIDFTTGSFAVLFSSPPVPLATLGLTAGETYTFSIDMINLDGPGGVGGFKVDFPGATPSTTGDIFPDVIGDGSTWETYEFTVPIPKNATSVTFVPLWGGENSDIGFDNAGVDNTPLTPIATIPNGGFETAAGADWDATFGGGTYVFDFPATGGNPDGFAEIDHSADDGGFGILVSNDGADIPLVGLGLCGGSTYTFSVDMRIDSGSNIGGFKVDFFNGAGQVGPANDERFPDIINTGSTWEKYDFEFLIPTQALFCRVVLIDGEGSVVQYDNVTVDPNPVVQAPVTEIPNGDFEIAGGDSWEEASGGAGTLDFMYPASGGNPDGFGIIDNTLGGGGFGILVSNDGVTIPLSGLGLVAGSTYKFSQDMIILEGSNIGGLKVDFFVGAGTTPAASTGKITPPIQGTGNTWETYDFEITIPTSPPGIDGIKVVLEAGDNSKVGYDNVTVDSTPITPAPVTELTNFDFEIPAGASWTPFQSDGSFTISFPASGGNPGGHAIIDQTGGAVPGSFAGIVAESGAIIPLSSLGFTPGNSYKFNMDINILSGVDSGGLKLDFFVGGGQVGSSPEFRPATGSGWQNYEFIFEIPTSPAGIDGIKVVPLWGSGSSIGFDNVTFDATPIPPAPITEIPNGDFEDGSDSWAEGGPPGTLFNYPGFGGNPMGYGIIDTTPAGFGFWISNNNSPIPIGPLGLTAGETYEFSQDMQIFDGTTIGAMKVEFFDGGGGGLGSTGDMFPALIGSGATWETYDFQVFIPPGTDGIKVIPVATADSEVGFDNVTVDPTPVILPPIPNGDFEIPAGANWVFDSDGPTVSYPASGGNPDGHAIIDATVNNGNFAFLIANGNVPQTLESLGLVAGATYIFQVDMKLLSGTELGGIQVEFVPGSSGILLPSAEDIAALPNPVTDWNTYQFEVMIPGGTTEIQYKLARGMNSSVAFDNVTIVAPEVVDFTAEIDLGTVVSWSTSSTTNLYQPQQSANNVDWTNLGPAVTGNAVTSVFDPDQSAFYRVLETVVPSGEQAQNRSFEVEDGTCAEDWLCLGSQAPTRVTSDALDGSASMQIQVMNDVGGAAQTSEIQQNVTVAGGTIIPGETYIFKFNAKQLATSGVSYVQQYNVQWLEAGGGFISNAVPFTNFTGGSGTWTEIMETGLVAPANADTALIKILGVTGAIADPAEMGGVLIDLVSFEQVITSPPVVEAVLNGGFEIPDTFDPLCAESWVCTGSQPPFNIGFDSNTGTSSMQLQVTNGGAVANTSEVNQNIGTAGGSVTPGATYNFSFFAKNVSGGADYMQEYRVQWLDGGGSVISDAIALTSFNGGNGTWSEVSVPSLVAPAGAASAFIQFIASTNAVGGASGEVLVDDVSLAEAPTPNVLPATSGKGVEVSWETETGFNYQVECTADLFNWVSAGAPIAGDGSTAAVTDLITISLKNYRVLRTVAP